MIPTCLVQAARDTSLRGVTLALYIVLFERLDFIEPRPAKLSALAKQTGVKKSNVSRAFARLIQRGYLTRGPDDGHRKTYRLGVSPTPLDTPVITDATSNAA